MMELVIVGDEAWTREEYEAEQRRLTKRRQSWRNYYARNRESRIAAVRAWQDSHPERARFLRNRSEWNRRRHPVGSLHDLACTGPTKTTGCRCHKIKMYDKPVL